MQHFLIEEIAMRWICLTAHYCLQLLRGQTLSADTFERNSAAQELGQDSRSLRSIWSDGTAVRQFYLDGGGRVRLRLAFKSSTQGQQVWERPCAHDAAAVELAHSPGAVS